MTLTATVSPSTATGTVTFYDGATMLATVALTGTDTASYSASTLAVGGHPVTAVYSGDANDAGSTSSILNQTVNPDNTHVALTVSNTAPVVGQKVTLKATVSVLPPGTGPATGSVTFFEGSTALGSATLSSGVASLLVPFTTAGPGSVTAVYSGNATDATSTSAGVSVSVGVDTTKTVLVVTPAAPVVGRTVTLKATVSVVAPGAGTPTGSVTFYDAGTSIGSVALTGTTASLPMTYATSGSHSFTATYSGDTNDNTSTSAASNLTVNPDTTKTVVRFSATPAVFGQSVTLTATVSAVAPGAGTPSSLDSVEFWDGARTSERTSVPGRRSAAASGHSPQAASRSARTQSRRFTPAIRTTSRARRRRPTWWSKRMRRPRRWRHRPTRQCLASRSPSRRR